LVASLRGAAGRELFSTWSPRHPPDLDCPSRNALPLHGLLSVYKRFPALQRGNHAYLAMCRMFDAWFTSHLKSGTRTVFFLSGCGLRAGRVARASGAVTVVESGSTHTDFQHCIVTEEYRRNGLTAPLFPAAYRDRVRREFEETDFIQIPSEFVRLTYLEKGIPAAKILKASYGADVSGFAAREKEDVAEPFRVICPSGVNLRKGARVLVEAWRRLGWKAAEAELHWIGWPNHPEVRHLFEPAPQGIVWHGWMSHAELAALYRSCDVLTLPSFEEGLARVLVEAAASGVALIATPNTGVEDFFTPGQPEGWLIPCGDVDALCAALAEARANRDATFALGQRGAARARNGFSWEDYGRQVRRNFALVTGASKP
jgi:glycosyltransferase involved in cell wall biosynthesis